MTLETFRSFLGFNNLDNQVFLLKREFRQSQKREIREKMENLLGLNKKKKERVFRKRNEMINYRLKKENYSFFCLPVLDRIISFTKKKFQIKSSNYLYSKNFSGVMYWRFRFEVENNIVYILISLYCPLLKIINYSRIKDQKLQVLIFKFYLISFRKNYCFC